MLRVLTLNVGSLFEPDWDSRRHEVVAWIDEVDPDMICLQEVWLDETANTAEWITAQLRRPYEFVFGGHPFGAWADKSSGFRFGSAILSRWPIDEHHLWSLPTAEDPDDPIPAAMPWELLHARSAGVDLYSTHLAPAPNHGRHRRLQVLAIDEHIRATRGDLDKLQFGTPRTAMPALLCGDFNAQPDSDEIRFLKGLTVIEERTTFYQDSWEVAGSDAPGYTQDWRTHELSASLNVPRKRIDYIFVGDPFMRAGAAGRVLDTRIVADEALTGIQASDHMGLLVEIEWPDRPK